MNEIPMVTVRNRVPGNTTDSCVLVHSKLKQKLRNTQQKIVGLLVLFPIQHLRKKQKKKKEIDQKATKQYSSIRNTLGAFLGTAQPFSTRGIRYT